MEPITETTTCYDQMLIVERYERVVAYLYPIAQSTPKRHGVARELFLNRLLSVPGLLYEAGKSNQVSKLYIVDAALAELRYWLRFLSTIKALTAHQLKTAQVLIAEVGKLLGAWIKRRKAQSKGRTG